MGEGVNKPARLNIVADMNHTETLRDDILREFLKSSTSKVMCELGAGRLTDNAADDIISAAHISFYQSDYDSSKVIKPACIEAARILLGGTILEEQELMIKRGCASNDTMPLKVYKALIINKDRSIKEEIKAIKEGLMSKGVAVFDTQTRNVFVSKKRLTKHHIPIVPNFTLYDLIQEYEEVFVIRIPDIGEYIMKISDLEYSSVLTSNIINKIDEGLQKEYWIDSKGTDLMTVRNNIGKLWLKGIIA